MKVDPSSGPYQLTAGTNSSEYWSPFPGFQCYPLILAPAAGGSATGSWTIRYTVSRIQ